MSVKGMFMRALAGCVEFRGHQYKVGKGQIGRMANRAMPDTKR
jgi:hypothetical protein